MGLCYIYVFNYSQSVYDQPFKVGEVVKSGVVYEYKKSFHSILSETGETKGNHTEMVKMFIGDELKIFDMKMAGGKLYIRGVMTSTTLDRVEEMEGKIELPVISSRTNSFEKVIDLLALK